MDVKKAACISVFISGSLNHMVSGVIFSRRFDYGKFRTFHTVSACVPEKRRVCILAYIAPFSNRSFLFGIAVGFSIFFCDVLEFC